MPIARTPDVELSYDRGGEGPPLLLIMGMSGTLRHWGEPFLADVRRDFDVIAYDHRGVGASTRLDGGLTIRGMAQDAAALMSALNVPTAHVFGVSMGGMIAQELALAEPSRVQTLTLGCTYCGGPGASLAGPEVIERLRAGMDSGDRATAIRTAWELNTSAAAAADDDSYARFLDAGAQYAVAVAVILAQMQACAVHEAQPRLQEISAPTLVVHGTEDVIIPPANAEILAERIPGARLEILDGAGHMFWWERPHRAAELVRQHAWSAATSS